MKQLKFLLTLLFSAVFTILATVACAPSDTTSDATGDASGDAPAETLIMATSADYPPYEFIQTESGSEEIVGFDIDIANEITSRLGYGLEITNMDFNALIPALQAGRADFVMAGMTPTEERKENVDFSDIYFEARNTIVAVAGSELTTIESLNGKVVGVQLGTIQEQAANEIEGIEVKPLNRINEIVQELKAGRVDAAIIEDTVAAGYIESNPDLEFNVIPNEGEAGSAIAFPKDSPLRDEMNAVLQEMLENGEIDELARKWFEQDLSEAA